MNIVLTLVFSFSSSFAFAYLVFVAKAFVHPDGKICQYTKQYDPRSIKYYGGGEYERR